MSLDLVVLTPENAASFDKAIAVYAEEEPGTSDDSGELEGYAREVYDTYDDVDWPFSGDPIVEAGCVLLTVAPEAWESEVPRLVERAHKRGLVALDPQWGGEGRLFPPGQPYA